MNNLSTLGLDLGGAHLKAALLDGHGTARWVMQLPCPLWRGLEHLQRALDEVLARLAGVRTHCAITMTGELADIFRDRSDGVSQLTATVAQRLAPENMSIYAGARGFVTTAQVEEYATDIASANWLASAEFIAAQTSEGLVVDIGSTTTDMLVIHQGKALPRGFSDAERLRTQELVYTGVVRTPVMALAQHIPFNGEWQGIAAEHFATMSDVYRLTGELEEAHDMSDTADGAGKTPQDSARRLARMVGRDLQEAGMADWQCLAAAFKRAQLRLLQDAAERSISRGLVADHAPLIGAGAGRFLARQLALQLGRAYVDIADLVSGEPDVRQWAAVCMPAYAVAWLASRGKR